MAAGDPELAVRAFVGPEGGGGEEMFDLQRCRCPRAWFEAAYGDDLFRVTAAEPVVHDGWHGRVQPV